jgi:hypothetical protein
MMPTAKPKMSTEIQSDVAEIRRREIDVFAKIERSEVELSLASPAPHIMSSPCTRHLSVIVHHLPRSALCVSDL